MEDLYFKGFSVSFKKGNGIKLYNLLVESDDALKASKIANEYMQKREIKGYNEYGISKHIIPYEYIKRRGGHGKLYTAIRGFNRKAFRVVIQNK